MVGGDRLEGKVSMKFGSRKLSIGHCEPVKAYEVASAEKDEGKIFKFGSEELPNAEAQALAGSTVVACDD